ncbi:MAG: acyltransferase [Dehalobacter sp.]|nr:acyltransferase [Dehalobacter sp.]
MADLSSKQKIWLHEIDVLRAIAIVIILFHHLYNYLIDKNSFIYYFIFNFEPYLRTVGLGLFFFVSGYVLYHNNSKFDGISDIIKFYRKRVIRIFPLYWLAILSYVIVFGYLKYFYWISPDSNFSFTTIIINLLGLQGILRPGLPIMWFISVILIFYIMYPIILYISKNTKILVILTIIIIFLMMILYAIFRADFNLMYEFFGIFMTGIIVRKISLFYDSRYEKYIPIISISLFLSLLIMFKFFNGGTPETVHTITIVNVLNGLLFILINYIFLVSICLIAYWSVKQIVPALKSKKIQIFNQVSYGAYSTYLFHIVWWEFFIVSLNKLGINGYYSDLLMLVIALPLAFIIGYFLQKMDDSIKLFSKHKVYNDTSSNRDNI